MGIFFLNSLKGGKDWNVQGKITHLMRNLLKSQIGANAILFLILLSVLSIKINFHFFIFLFLIAFGSFRSKSVP